jgi:hypothetical protein
MSAAARPTPIHTLHLSSPPTAIALLPRRPPRGVTTLRNAVSGHSTASLESHRSTSQSSTSAASLHCARCRSIPPARSGTGAPPIVAGTVAGTVLAYDAATLDAIQGPGCVRGSIGS